LTNPLVRKILKIILLLAIVYRPPLIAQNLEAIRSEKPLHFSGGLSLSQIGYSVNGIAARRDPYNYFLSGSLVTELYGMSIPLSFMLSNQNNSFQQPFNQFGLTPTFKAFTGHLGYASMTFSPYTLNGHIFMGVGADYKPTTSKFSISAMYGRLQKAVQADTTDQNNVPSFRRMAYGLKLGYDHQGDFVHLIAFRAADEPGSLTYIPNDGSLLPEQNLVLSIQAGKRLGPISITGEMAGSAINRDARLQKSELESKNVFSYTGPLFEHTDASEYYNAYRTNINYNGELFTVGVGYERIDPGYRTLGAYYFNNDLRNITLNASTRLLQDKLNISGNVGTQRNNLDNQETNDMSRFVGSVNVAYAPSHKLNLSASYSSFNTYTVIRSAFTAINQVTPTANLDTLNYTQISQSTSMSASYNASNNPNVMRMLIVNMSYQQATDKQAGEIQDTGSRFINGNVAYSHQVSSLGAGFTLAVNTNFSTAGDLKSSTLGPTVGINKSLLKKKMQTSLTVSYNTQLINEQRNNNVTNIRLTSGYRISKHHNVSLSGIVLDKTIIEESSPDFTEYTVTLGYNYNF
jgi:hypothetical protein